MNRRLVGILILLTVLATTLTGCVGGPLMRRAADLYTGLAEPTATPVPSLKLQAPTATPLPKPTATPAPPTPVPTATSVPKPSATPTTALPQGPQVATYAFTEAELNDYVADAAFAESGVEITDAEVELTPSQMAVRAYIEHASTGMAGDIYIYGVPVAVEGKLYFKVDKVDLGSQFTGFVRMIALGMFEQAITDRSSQDGLEIPLGKAGFTPQSVELGEGTLSVTGLQE